MRLSVIIPAHREPHLQRTIDSLLENSALGKGLEVIVVLDGPWLEAPLMPDYRLQVIHLEKRGMRAAINAGLDVARGEFVLKADAHCAFAPGFDKAMADACEDDWLLVPRRYSLDERNWIPMKRRPVRDYHYLAYPAESRWGRAMTPQNWGLFNVNVIDDVMTYQGSCWAANRACFMERVGFLDDRPETYGPFVSEMLEVGLKYWLGGGRVKVNKGTWYAHLAKRSRHYASGEYLPKSECQDKANFEWATRHWINDEEPGMAYPFSWLVERFWPVPTWPADRNEWRLN